MHSSTYKTETMLAEGSSLSFKGRRRAKICPPWGRRPSNLNLVSGSTTSISCSPPDSVRFERWRETRRRLCNCGRLASKSSTRLQRGSTCLARDQDTWRVLGHIKQRWPFKRSGRVQISQRRSLSSSSPFLRPIAHAPERERGEGTKEEE